MAIKRYFAGPGAQYDDEMAEKLGNVLESLGDAATPQAVVDAARPKKSPIHKLFEWDNDIAAEKYRIHQARVHITRLRIEIVSNGESTETRAYHSIVIAQGESKQRAYVGTTTIMAHADLREQAIENALRQLRLWRDKYKEYKEVFRELFTVIDGVLERVPA